MVGLARGNLKGNFVRQAILEAETDVVFDRRIIGGQFRAERLLGRLTPGDFLGVKRFGFLEFFQCLLRIRCLAPERSADLAERGTDGACFRNRANLGFDLLDRLFSLFWLKIGYRLRESVDVT